jgi:hypothetical protein
MDMTNPILALGLVFSVQGILHYKHNQYANFQCPDIIGSILECGLLLTIFILPMPGLDYVIYSASNY